MSAGAIAAARAFFVPRCHFHFPLHWLRLNSSPPIHPFPRIRHRKAFSLPFSSLSIDELGPPGKSGGGSIEWDYIPGTATAPVDTGSPGSPASPVKGHLTVVLLGWLGATQRHMRKYTDMYHTLGVRSIVRFVVPLPELVGVDLGRRVEMRALELSLQLADWCRGDADRSLLFHTFSNTGWLAYGVILENLQSKIGIAEKIKGCVVDSGPSAEINPEVFAAGFAAAMLKKSSSKHSVKYADGGPRDSSTESNKDAGSSLSWSEVFLFSILQKSFQIILRLPNVNRRLSRIISYLSENQPFPQLYLYSSADKVIPANSVESFIRDQRSKGRDVSSNDFVSSPHVDHFRSFPGIYSTKIDEFLRARCPSGL